MEVVPLTDEVVKPLEHALRRSRMLTIGMVSFLVLGTFRTASADTGQQTRIAPHLKAGVEALIAAYPEILSHYTNTHLVTTDGAQLLLDDRRRKTHAEKLADADIEDSLSQSYPAHTPLSTPDEDFDPGRIRAQHLLDVLYGTTREETEKTLVPVGFFGTTLRVTSRYGMAGALKRVVHRLKQNQSLRKWLVPPGGTYNWRYIAGTKRRSMHSYGLAVDLNVKRSRYWRWDRSSKRKPFNPSKFPRLIVEAFEHEGFVWGGRWYHYDSMHFEYRPGLINLRRR